MKTTFVREVAVNYRGPRIKFSEVLGAPDAVAKVVRKVLPDNSREHFVAIYLNGAHEVIAYSIVATGLANSCPIHPREIFQPAILSGAVALIVSHNHPSGNTTPSMEDRRVTERLKEAADLVGIRLLDHVIVTDDNFYSIETGEKSS